MIIFACLLIQIIVQCRGAHLGSDVDKVVFVTPEMGFIEGEFDITPLLQSIQSLRALSRDIKTQCHLPRSVTCQSRESAKVSKWILEHVEIALIHIEERLRSLGFLKRSKRSPFAFIGNIQSALFGTVSENQFSDFKSHISSNFRLIHTDNRELRGLVSENREALRKTLNVLNTVRDQILNELDDNSKLFTRFFQIGFALDSIERIVMILMEVKTSADRNYLSRYIFTPSILRNHILQLSDGLYGQSPIFNSRSIDHYYKIPISLSTVTGTAIRQIVSVPMISSGSKFHLSHRPNCPTAHVCVENNEGVVTIPISDYLTCEAVTTKLIPTICRMRACITSDRTVCRMTNITSAVVSSEVTFPATIDCDGSHSSQIEIYNITVISLPIHCSLNSVHLKIRKIDSMKNSTTSHNIIYIPFSISEGELILNTSTDHQQQQARGLETRGLQQLLLTKVPRGHEVSQHLLFREGHHPISLSSISISTIGLFATIVLFLLLFCCRHRIFKSINPN